MDYKEHKCQDKLIEINKLDMALRIVLTEFLWKQNHRLCN